MIGPEQLPQRSLHQWFCEAFLLMLLPEVGVDRALITYVPLQVSRGNVADPPRLPPPPPRTPARSSRYCMKQREVKLEKECLFQMRAKKKEHCRKTSIKRPEL